MLMPAPRAPKDHSSRHSKIDRSLTYLSPLFYITVDLKWILL
jgi:hypothetical protein